MTHVITQNCVNDASCVPVCPVNCIHPAPGEPGYLTAEMLHIDPQACIDCGACLEVCPVNAIVPDFELTARDEPFRELNAAYFDDPGRRDYAATGAGPAVVDPPAGPDRPLRVAIVGSGPSGFYAAERLLAARALDVDVSLLERLPVPFGLARFGVAPDHQDTKAVTSQFSRTGGRRRLTMYLGVEVGTQVSHEDLLGHHDAVIYAVGAADDRRLNVPGEDLPGSISARSFVAWYNGHPDHAAEAPDLSGERAVIVGNGNVALDAARVLTAGTDYLAATDIADHALAALADSGIEEVLVLGRRGPAQAAFTTPELLGLLEVPGIDVIVDPADLELPADVESRLDAAARTKLGVLRDLAGSAPTPGAKRIVLRFYAAPVEVLGDQRVTGVRIARTTLVENDGRVEAQPTGEVEEVGAGLVLRSVGYRSRPVPGLPFDEAAGRIPHREGRVVDPETGEAVPGAFVVGWLKRGPSGVIGTNKFDAQETVDALLADLAAAQSRPLEDPAKFAALMASVAPEVLSFDQWRTVDRHERALGKEAGRPRVKLSTVEEIRAVARG